MRAALTCLHGLWRTVVSSCLLLVLLLLLLALIRLKEHLRSLSLLLPLCRQLHLCSLSPLSLPLLLSPTYPRRPQAPTARAIILPLQRMQTPQSLAVVAQ